MRKFGSHFGASQEGTILILVAAFFALVAIAIGVTMNGNTIFQMETESCTQTTPCPEMVAAVQSGNDVRLRQLLVDGANPNLSQAENGDNIMHIAVREGQLGLLATLLKHGGDPNLANKNGVTPFALIVGTGHRGYVQQLIHGGARVNGAFPNTTNDGRPGMVTPLMIAAERGDELMVNMLLAAGASRAATDSKGQSAADYAQSQHHDELVRKLEY